MKKLETQKGITLVALIITIVVLLILAVVSIGAVQNSNIVGYAQNAAGEYEIGKENENNAISNYEDILDKYGSIANNGGTSNIRKESYWIQIERRGIKEPNLENIVSRCKQYLLNFRNRK